MTSTSRIFSQTISDFQSIQQRLFDNQSKIGADSQFSTFSELGSDLTTVQSFQESLSRSQRFITSLNEVKRNLDVTYRAVDDIIAAAVDFKSVVNLENSTTSANVNDLGTQADNNLDLFRGFLNTRNGANYVFSGSKTNVEPVGDLKGNSNYVSGQSTANYYSGDDFRASADATRSLRIEYGITAAEQPFQDLLAAVNRAKAGEGDQSEISAAGADLENAIDSLIALRAKMGGNLEVVEQSIEIQERASLNFQEELSAITDPDIVELTIQTSNDTAALTAVFQNFGRIADLSLVNFLN